MKPSGEKTEPLATEHTTAEQHETAPPMWTAKEKDERSEWFLVIGFIVAFGVGVISISVISLIFLIHRGPELVIDLFLCAMAICMGLFFLIASGYGLYRLKRMKPGQSIAERDHANSRH